MTTCLSVTNVGVRLLVFVAADVDCFVLLIYISFYLSLSLSLCQSFGGKHDRSAWEEEARPRRSRACRKRRGEIEASRSSGTTTFRRWRRLEKRKRYNVHVSPYTRVHPRGDPADANRSDIDCYSIRVFGTRPAAKRGIDNTCNTKRLAHAQRQHIRHGIINSLLDRALMFTVMSGDTLDDAYDRIYLDRNVFILSFLPQRYTYNVPRLF